MLCARLFLPPDANWATREASGWKMEEPSPMVHTAKSNRRKCPAKAKIMMPARVKHMPIDNA